MKLYSHQLNTSAINDTKIYGIIIDHTPQQLLFQAIALRKSVHDFGDFADLIEQEIEKKCFHIDL